MAPKPPEQSDTKIDSSPLVSNRTFDPDWVDISSFRLTIRFFADRPSIGLFLFYMAKYDIHIMESLPGVLGNRGNDIYSRGTGNKGHILSGTGFKGKIGEHGT